MRGAADEYQKERKFEARWSPASAYGRDGQTQSMRRIKKRYDEHRAAYHAAGGTKGSRKKKTKDARRMHAAKTYGDRFKPKTARRIRTATASWF